MACKKGKTHVTPLRKAESVGTVANVPTLGQNTRSGATACCDTTGKNSCIILGVFFALGLEIACRFFGVLFSYGWTGAAQRIWIWSVFYSGIGVFVLQRNWCVCLVDISHQHQHTMGRRSRPRGYIRLRRLRRTAVYKRMPTMFKKARELYENCGVNVTMVTEDEGVYHFYNTAMMTHQEVFERYLLLIHQTPHAFVTEVPILDAANDNALESACVESPGNPLQGYINAVCVDDLDMSMEDSEQINANFQAVQYVSAIASVCTQSRPEHDKVDATKGLACGSTADEKKKIRQDQEKDRHKQARLEARKTLRRKKREELRSKAVAAANTNACESAPLTKTLTSACETTEAAKRVQKRKKPAVFVTSRSENEFVKNDSSHKKIKTASKFPSDSVEQNAAHRNTLTFAAETAHSAD